MGFGTKISLISFTFLTIQSSVLILNAKSLTNGEVKFESSNTTEEILTIIPRQDENTDIREYESIPRVVASVSKIFKGVVSGNVHDIFHGAFSFAPVDVSKRLISVYNQVVGFPLRTTTTEEPPETTTAKRNSTKFISSGKGNNSTEVLSELSESQELPEDEEDDEDEEYDDEEFRRRNLNKTKAPPPVTEAVTENETTKVNQKI